jgi:hypothetical protein
VIPTISSQTGIIRLGDQLVDINLYVNLANREYYNVTDIRATLSVGDDTPFIPGENSTLTGKSTVLNKWYNPANNYVCANGQNYDNMYFNLNLHPDADPGTYYLDMTLQIFNERTMTELTVPTTLEVKIYPKIAKLRITNVIVSTGSIKPGKEFTLQLTIQNDGGEAAREIYIDFEEAYITGEAIIESFDEVNPTGAKYPFSSDIMKAYIQEILPHSTGTATFTVVGDLNIYPGVTYFQNIEFNYKDSTGYEHSSTDVVPINSDSSTEAKVDGVKYYWDTDREAWISENELRAEEVTDYMPWMISLVVVIWLVTLLIVFFFIIKPRYLKERTTLEKDYGIKPKRRLFGRKKEEEEYLESSYDTTESDSTVTEPEEEPVTNTEPAESQNDEETNIVDYPNDTEESTPSNMSSDDEYPPSPRPKPTNPPQDGPKPAKNQTDNAIRKPPEYATTPVSLAPPAPHSHSVKAAPANQVSSDEHNE